VLSKLKFKFNRKLFAILRFRFLFVNIGLLESNSSIMLRHELHKL